MTDDIPELREFRWQGFTLFGGVILPSFSIGLEAITHMCADIFFDPIPTTWHLLLVVFVPLAHLQVWLALRKGSTQRRTLLGFANVLALGISVFYSIVYIPLLPVSLLALVFIMGVLPLTPYFSLVASIILWRQLRRNTPRSFPLKTAGVITGVALAFVMVALLEIPASLTRMGLQMASSVSAEQRAKGIRWLRAVGDRDYLLRACYTRTGRATDLIGYLLSLNDPVTTDEARKIYYRVTGEPFNSRLPPKRVAGRWIPQDTMDFDSDQGETTIAGKVKGLSLASSRLDGSTDAEAGLAYMQWTLAFKNETDRQQEARAEVQLPAGGVVSRLTLWVDGQEREAAFAGRSKAREAYQQIVRQRRDPVLVTTAGRDRILVQCFPVPPKGGEMKIRVGITTPLVMEDLAHGALLLPHFLNRNFRIPNELTHTVWVESKMQMQSANSLLQAEAPRTGLYAVRGMIPDVDLSNPDSSIRLARSTTTDEVWSRNAVMGEGKIIRQILRPTEGPPLARLVIVVDGSRSMHESVSEISTAIKALPREIDIKLIVAGDNVNEKGAYHPVTANSLELAQHLEREKFEGGADNVPALAQAWDLAAENSNAAAIVWIHGPQGIQIQPVEDLRQRWDRRPHGPKLYTVQTNTGHDAIEEKLDGITAVESVARMGRLQSDLERLFGQLSGRVKPLEFVRTSEKLDSEPALLDSKETSAHLARLWANDEVERLRTNSDSLEEAVKLAVQYQLVTPVSGAVVLETQEQYRAAGLQPVDAGTVPTIPEPEMIILVAVVAALLLWLLYRQRLRGKIRQTV